MNSKFKSIIIGSVALLVLVGVMVVLILTDKPQDIPENSENINASVEILWQFDREDVKKVEVTNEKGSFVAEQKEDKTLTIPKFSEYPLNQNDLIILQNSVATVSATRKIEEKPENIEKYGLTSPFAEVKVTFNDGTVNTLKLGGKLITDGGYYAIKDGDSAVYAVATIDVNKFLYKDVDFIDRTIIETTSPDTSVVDWFEVSGANFKEKPLRVAIDNQNVYFIESPMKVEFDTISGENLLNGIHSLSANEVAAVGEKSKYGFDAPYATVEYSKDSVSGYFTVGDETTLENGNPARYVMGSKTDIIYKVGLENLPWATAKLDNLFSSFILIPNVKVVDSVVIFAGNENYTFKSKGEGSNLIATLNGNEITSDNYRAMYEFLISASAKEINYGARKGELIAKVTYKYRDSKKSDDVIEFFASDDRKCIISLNGSESFLTETRYADKILSNCQKVANGEKPSLDY